MFWLFTIWINYSSGLKNFANSRPSASNFQSFSQSLEQFFLTVGRNNFGNKIPFLTLKLLKNLEFINWRLWYMLDNGFVWWFLSCQKETCVAQVLERDRIEFDRNGTTLSFGEDNYFTSFILQGHNFWYKQAKSLHRNRATHNHTQF